MLKTARCANLLLMMSLSWIVLMGSSVRPAAAFLTGVPTFVTPPTSQLGPIVFNSLTITPLTNGFSVTGQVHVNVPATSTPIGGLLLAYEVDYPVDPTYPFNPALFTSTIVSGFSQPPIGLAGNTAGVVDSVILTLPSTPLAPSLSNVPLFLVNGIDSPPWTPPLVGNSSVFGFAGAPNMVLRQRFTLDGIYNTGPGGLWIIDLPADTIYTVVPEPSTALLVLGGMAMIFVRRQRR